MRKNYLIIFPALLFFPLLFLNAQPKPAFKTEKFNVQSFSFEQGLQNNTVKDVVTDTVGFTWISTQSGLEKYNGNIFESVYPVIGKDTIKINSFAFILKLKSGLLWIAYDKGILEYNPFIDRYRKIFQPSRSKLFFFPLKEDNDGIWFLENDKQLVKFNKKTGLVQDEFPFASNSSTTYNLLLAEPLATRNDEYIFITNDQGSVGEINTKTHEAKTINFPVKEIMNMDCSQHTLYVSSSDYIISYDIDQDKILQKTPTTFFVNETNARANIHLIQHSYLLLSLDNRLFRLDTAFHVDKEYLSENGSPVVQTGFIDHFTIDRFNRLWLITNDDIKKVQNADIPFENFYYANAKNNFVRCFYFDKQTNQLLAGCYKGGLQLYDSLGNALWDKPLLSDNVREILNIEKLKPDTYLIITFTKGWYILTLSTKELKPFNFGKFIDSSFTKNIFFTSGVQRMNDSLVYISSPKNVYKCYFNKEKLLRINPCFLPKDIDTNTVGAFHLASNGTLWAGTINGRIYTLSAKRGFALIQLSENFSVRCVMEDAKYNMWIGTDKGLYQYSASQQLLKTYFIENGLKNDCIYSLAVDKKNNAIFAGTNSGISKINDDGSIKNYDKESGLQNNEFNTQAFTSSPNGKFFFGSISGITSFYPAVLNLVKDHPALLIYKFDVNNEAYKNDSACWSESKLELDYDQNKLSFSLSAAGIQSASDYQYEYKMENFDKDWAITNNPIDIRYSLSPGTYFFKVKLTGFPGMKVQEIIIATPFWQRWWFYVCIIIAFIFIIFLISKSFYRKKYADQLYALEIQQKLYTERERISRDLHDNLGAYTSAISTQVEEITHQFGVQNNVAVQQLKSSAREIMFQLRDTIWALNKERISITMLSDRIKNYIQKISPSYSNIEFDVEEQIEAERYLSSVNGLHIFRIIQEAIHNAIKHSNCNNITVNFFSGKVIAVSISDNGKGLLQANNSEGNGIKNMQARAKEIDWELEFKNGNGKGFVVELKDNSNTK